jgi:hypothetical protein
MQVGSQTDKKWALSVPNFYRLFNISEGCGLIAIYLVGLFVCENKTPQKWRFVCVVFEG